MEAGAIKLEERIRDIFSTQGEATDRLATLIEVLDSHRPEDIAEILSEFSDSQRQEIFFSLDEERAAEVLIETDDKSRTSILEATQSVKLKPIVLELDPDDQADVVADLPPDQAEEVLGMLEDDEAQEIESLLRYDPDSAGGIMTTDVAKISQNLTAGEAINALKEAIEAETIHFAFAVDRDDRLTGVVSLGDLMTTSPKTPLREVMERDVVSAHIDEDQENVAKKVDKYDLPIIPVIDGRGILKGIITLDDIMDVVTEEVTEDMMKMAGTTVLHPTKIPVLAEVRGRVSYLFLSLIGGAVAILIQWYFRGTLEQILPLVFFIPVIMAMAGSVGLQGATVIVRGLATGEVDPAQGMRVFWRQVRVALLIGFLFGFVCGIPTAAIAPLLDPSLNGYFGLAVGIGMFNGIALAGVIGTAVPLVCHKLGIDPAIASGPFVTAANDMFGLLCYLGVSRMMMDLIQCQMVG